LRLGDHTGVSAGGRCSSRKAHCVLHVGAQSMTWLSRRAPARPSSEMASRSLSQSDQGPAPRSAAGAVCRSENAPASPADEARYSARRQRRPRTTRESFVFAPCGSSESHATDRPPAAADSQGPPPASSVVLPKPSRGGPTPGSSRRLPAPRLRRLASSRGNAPTRLAAATWGRGSLVSSK